MEIIYVLKIKMQTIILYKVRANMEIVDNVKNGCEIF